MLYYLFASFCTILMELLSIPFAFIVPLKPEFFSWFLTPDNPIEGDKGHQERWKNKSPYLQKVMWLLRNRAYGFKLNVVGCEYNPNAKVEGDPDIKNRTNARAGLLRMVSGKYFYYKIIYPIGFNYCVQLAFGWQLNAPINGRCLLMFSPRITRFYEAKDGK